MLKVWGRRNSSNVQKVLWLCDEAELKFEHEEIGGQFARTRDPDMLARNPNAKVPTIDDDSFVLWESNAILRYLAAKYSPGNLWPDDLQARADADRWMDWQQTTVLAPMTTIFWGRVRAPDDYTPQQIDAAVTEAAGHWRILDERLEARRWVIGDGFTVADIALGVMAWRWFSLIEDPPATPSLEAWFRRLKARPPFEDRVSSIPLT